MFENERKFLVNRIPNLEGIKKNEIEQGYISFLPEVRIRKKGNEFFLTHKGEGNQIRTEIETNISAEVYDILSLLVKEKFINKTRYEIKMENGIVVELDIYHGDLDGLVTVEVEFKSEVQLSKFIVPEWFGKEITSDKRYKNKNLARSISIKELVK